jgi:cyclohexanecarboxylate-CoA ligase
MIPTPRPAARPPATAPRKERQGDLGLPGAALGDGGLRKRSAGWRRGRHRRANLRGMSEALYGSTTLWELLERRAEATPDRRALTDEAGRTATFGDLRAAAARTAAGLHAAGVGMGDVVAWQLPTRIDTIVCSLALCRLGAVQNPILHMYREREVAFALHQLRPKVVLTPGEWRGFDYEAMALGLAAELTPAPRVVVADTLDDGDPSTLPPFVAAPDERRWIYYTSGTTADPKGVVHTDRTLIAGGEGLARAMGVTPDDVGSIAFPFTHIAGPDYLVMMLVLGFGSVLVEAFSPADAVAFYRASGVTVAGGSTAFYSMFLAEQRKQPGAPVIPTLRMLSGGGAPKPPEIFFEVQRELGVRILHGYGMTEVPMITMGTPNDTDEQLAYTDGRPVVGAEVRIVGWDGAPAPTGVDGEVRVRGPMVCAGYTDPALTADAFDDAGFFRTGDLGHLRDDGHIVLTGRLKDLIIRKGENISAREIEDVLYALPNVAGVAVIGLPDPERGERVCAVVEPVAGLAPPTFDEVVAACRAAGLMTQKIPEQLEIVDALPRNQTLNKVLKHVLRDQFAPRPWTPAPPQD